MTTATMQKGKVSAYDYLTDDTVLFRINLAENSGFSFKPGQFIVLDVGHNQSRSYSVCSASSNSNHIDLCVKLLPQGDGSNFIRQLKVDDEISFRGPFGTFFLQENETLNLLFVATGTGLAPIYAMLLALAESNSDKNIHLLFGLRNEKNLFLIDKLDELKKDLLNFSYTITLSRPIKDDCPYQKGRVTDYLENNYNLDSNWDVYLCGGNDMIIDVRKLLTNNDFPQKNIFTESFY